MAGAEDGDGLASDQLAARGNLGSVFEGLVRAGLIEVEQDFGVTHIGERDGKLRIGAGSACCGRHVMADELVVATGFRSLLAGYCIARLSA